MPGTNAKTVAYRPWVLGRLLDDANMRNQYKYLVALYHGNIVGTFCIHGISLDIPNNGSKRKVKFLLENTDDNCDEELKKIINKLISLNPKKIRMIMSSSYFDINYLKSYGINTNKISCDCNLSSGKIPILDSNEIFIQEDQLKENF